MNLVDPSESYRLLGVSPGASLDTIKQAYRRLARQYHPDVAGEQSKERFQQVNEAYRVLCTWTQEVQQAPPTPSSKPQPQTPTKSTPASIRMEVKRAPSSSSPLTPKPMQTPTAKARKLSGPELQDFEKRVFYLKKALKSRDWVYALSQAESLFDTFPGYPEAIHLLAITYQRRGNALIIEKKYSQARAYLAKALQTEPNNKALAFEIERDLQRISQSSQG
jgi:tetratricopeptide (TPR) repeat protein